MNWWSHVPMYCMTLLYIQSNLYYQSPSNSIKDTCTVFWPSKIKILCCLETNREGKRGGGGGLNLTQSCPCFYILEKNWDISNTKRVDMPNLSNLENRYEIVIWGQLAWSYSIMLNPLTTIAPVCAWNQDPSEIPLRPYAPGRSGACLIGCN